ncbi:MAG: diaminopimelate decarboxylase [Sphingomonadales bacterium]|jgi:diaminopimelate decarboxylase
MITREEYLQAAQQFGTPLFVYDADQITSQYKRLVEAFSVPTLKLHYALKALNNSNILKLLKAEGAGLDAVSIQEVQLGLRAGFDPSQIMFTPNSIAFDELVEAVEYGVHVNIDNLPMLEKFGAKYGSTVPCCVRINPHILAGGNHHISVGHIDSKFGISIHQIKHIERITKHFKIKVNGLHMHTGSDIIDPDVFLRGAELLFDAAQHFEDLTFMDFGSGFKVSYKSGDIVSNIEDLGQKISAAFELFCSQYGRSLELWFEPGKFLVSESGMLLVKANLIKQTTSTVFVGVDSGQNHLIRPMFYNAYHHITNLSNPEGPEKLYSVVGYICESDTLGHDRLLNEVHENDILAIHNAGAYAFSMSNNYNARLKPAEVLYYKSEMHLIRKREVLSDLYKNEIELNIS